MHKVIHVYNKSVDEVVLDGLQEEIYKTLKSDGHKVDVNRYGLKISGRRVSWQSGWFLAFLGTPVGKRPKIVKVA